MVCVFAAHSDAYSNIYVLKRFHCGAGVVFKRSFRQRFPHRYYFSNVYFFIRFASSRLLWRRKSDRQATKSRGPTGLPRKRALRKFTFSCDHTNTFSTKTPFSTEDFAPDTVFTFFILKVFCVEELENTKKRLWNVSHFTWFPLNRCRRLKRSTLEQAKVYRTSRARL